MLFRSDAGNRAGHRGSGAVNAIQGYGGGSCNSSNRHTGISAGKPPRSGKCHAGFRSIRIVADPHGLGLQQLLFPAAGVILDGGYGVGFADAVDRDGGVASRPNIKGIVGQIHFQGDIGIVAGHALCAAPLAVQAEAGNGIILKRALPFDLLIFWPSAS